MDGVTAQACLEKSINITLSKFIKHGKRKNVKVNSIGYTNWIKAMKKRLPIKVTRNI